MPDADSYKLRPIESRDDAAVARALEELKDNAAFFKVLGSYPQSL